MYTALEVLALPAVPLTMTAGLLFGVGPGVCVVSVASTLGRHHILPHRQIRGCASGHGVVVWWGSPLCMHGTAREHQDSNSARAAREKVQELASQKQQVQGGGSRHRNATASRWGSVCHMQGRQAPFDEQKGKQPRVQVVTLLRLSPLLPLALSNSCTA